MAQHRTGAGVQERSAQKAVERKRLMAQRVDAGVNAVQASGLYPSGNAPRVDAERLELGDTYDPVLAPGELCQANWVPRPSLSGGNGTQIGHGGSVTTKASPNVAARDVFPSGMRQDSAERPRNRAIARRVWLRLRRSSRCRFTWRRMSSANSWIECIISGEASRARRVVPFR